MNPRPHLLVGLAALAALHSGCSACDDASVQDGEVQAPDYRFPHSDLPPSDLGPDLPCGGSRTIQLEPVVERRGGLPCGPGCRQVTFGAEVFLSHEVKGDLLVYAGGSSMDSAVYLVDLARNLEWLVRRPRHPGMPGCLETATDGHRIAYECTDWEDPKQPFYLAALQVFDPATGIESDLECVKLVPNKSSFPERLTLGATGIAAQLSLTAGPEVDAFFHRFSDGRFTNLSHRFGGVWHTHMSGARLVWTEIVNQTQIVLYDTLRRTRRVLDPTGKAQFIPRIEGDRVVWVDHRNAPGDMYNQTNSDIYLHDLSTGTTVPVTTHPARQDFPDVDGDWVVWQDWRNNPNPTPQSGFKNADIFARNMKIMQLGEELQVTDFPGQEVRPQVDRGRVFYRMAGKDGRLALFMVDLAALSKR